MTNVGLALDQLRKLSRGPSQTKVKASAAVRFLEFCTHRKHATGNVKMQETKEQYLVWGQVEKHLLPMYKPLPVYQNGAMNGFVRHVGRRLARGEEADSSSPSSVDAISAGSSSTTTSPDGSPNRANFSSYGEASRATQVREWRQTQHGANGAIGGTPCSGLQGGTRSMIGVPVSQQDLLNAVVWQLTQTKRKWFEDKSLILITSSTETARWAQTFGITVKTLGQLGAAIKAGQDYEDLLAGSEAILSREPSPIMDSDGEEVIVFKPRARKVLPPIGAERKSQTPSLSSSDGGVSLNPVEERKSQTPPAVADRREEVFTPVKLNPAEERKSQTPPAVADLRKEVSTPATLNPAEEHKSQTPPAAADSREELCTPVISVDSFSRDLPIKPVSSVNGVNGINGVDGTNGGASGSDIKEPTFGRLSPPKSGITGEPSNRPTRPRGPKFPFARDGGNAFRRREARDEEKMAADVDFKLNSGAPRSASHGKGKLWQP